MRRSPLRGARDPERDALVRFAHDVPAVLDLAGSDSALDPQPPCRRVDHGPRDPRLPLHDPLELRRIHLATGQLVVEIADPPLALLPPLRARPNLPGIVVL